MKKIDLSKTRSALVPLGQALTVYLIYFLVAEILISGGRYERDIYLWAVIFGLVILIELSFTLKKKIKDTRAAILTGLWFALPIVIADYLIVNLIMEGNSFSIFHRWETITVYGVTLLLPLIVFVFKSGKSKPKQIDELLTNHKPTL